MEHLALEIFDLKTKDNPNPTGSKYANLPEDASITITDTSEIFASGDVWSHPFTLNVFANAHIFGTAGDIHGSRLHEQINKRRARLWVEGLPLYLGYLKLDDEVEVDEDGNVDVTFESGQKTFEEMIEGAKANQVPFTEDVLIGMALWPEREVDLRLNVRVTATIKEGAQYDYLGRVTSGTNIVFPSENSYETINVSSKDIGISTNYPRMVFPKGVFAVQGGTTPTGGVTVNQLNTDYAYDDGRPYCNVAVCYQKHGYPTENGTTNYSAEEQALRGYEIAPANRVNSAPNFFVLYWLKCLMKHIGINIAENQLMDVEDLRRLFFVNTNCAYEIPNEFDRSGANASTRYGCFTTYQDNDYIAELFEGTVDVSKSKLDAESFTWESYSNGEYKTVDPDSWVALAKMQVSVVGQINYTDTDKDNYVAKNRRFHYAYATNECFPNVDISEVIKALEDGFGIRFLFSENYQRVRIVLLRNVLRSTEVQEIQCEIADDDVKVENSIRGFRMTYGDKKDDTTFYYKGFADKMAKANELWADNTDTHDYSHWNLNADYGTLIKQISAFDKTCYVTPINGNAYGIKIDKDAKAYEELRPSLFEYAGYMDAEDGDCTGEDETIKTVNMGFVPAIMNDMNFENERDNGSTEQQFALFVSEEMRSRRPDLEDKALPASYNDSDAVYDVNKIPEEKKKLGLFSINSDMPVRKTISGEKRGVNLVHNGNQYNLRFRYSVLAAGFINEGYRLYLQDNYEPNDDGVSPIETKDWGLTLGIMRGSGSDAYVNYTADPDDGEENDTWDIVAGSSATAHPDTCDNYGNLWNYDDEAGRSCDAYYLQAAGWSVSAGSDDMASCIYHYVLNGIDFLCTPIKYTRPGARPDWNPVLTKAELEAYVTDLWNQYGWNFGEHDWWKLILSAKNANGSTAYADGRFSLKLRAEKLNPYFDPKQPEGNITVSTKAEAASAMTRLFTTSNTNLLARPKVSNATMRAAGWNAPGDGYATVMSMGYGVEYSDGVVHEILWTPIKSDGSVLTQAQLQTYVNSFNGLASSAIISHDTQHLILDIDTTDARGVLLHKLQAIYYAEEGETVDSVTIPGSNPRYLEITNPNLRGRGLADQFYKEYSYWIRNARIVKRTVRMELAQLLAINKTKRVTVGDVTGFINKMQYSISNQTGLGMVRMEIMYI